MDEDDDDMVGWEDDDDGADANPDADADGEDIAWEDDDDDDDAVAEGAHEQDKDEDQDEDQDGEPEERRWLGDDGEIVVELPREDESEDGLHEAEPGDGDGDGRGKGKGKQKAKARRFTAEENRQALNVHKAHLSCLVARCAVVSRWAGDPSVQAAMVSCLPIDLLPKKPVPVEPPRDSLDGRGELEVAPKQGQGLPLAALVVWFREFLTVLDDGAVGGGGGGEGSWGSRPSRLLRVIDQRVGCAQEAVQLFVALCRGLGLRARYVSCLDPLPPFPRSLRPAKQTRNNTVDLVAVEGRGGRQHRQSGGQAGAAFGGSQAWAEVLCRGDGESLRVVTGTSRYAGQPPPPPPPPSPTLVAQPRPLKRRRTESSKSLSSSGGGSSAEPLSLDSDDDGDDDNDNNDVRDATSGRGGHSGVDASTGDNDRGGGSSGGSGGGGGGDDDDGSGGGKMGRRFEGSGRKPAAIEGLNNETEERQAAAPKAGGGAAAEVGAEAGAGAGAGAGVGVGAEVSVEPAEKITPRRNSRGKRKMSAAGAGDDKTKAAPLSQVIAAPQRKADSSTGSTRIARRRSPRGRAPREQSAETPDSTSNVSDGGVSASASASASGGGGGGGSSGNGGSGAGGDSGGDGSGSEKTSARLPIGSEKEISVDGEAAETAAETGAEPGKWEGKEAGVGGAGSVAASAGARERWVHVDPVLGAADQPEKVQGLRFRKQLMPYVVAEDEKRAIVDVTRRYSSQWSRTLRTRGRAMASQDGWWSLALRQWGASSVRGAGKARKDRSGRPLPAGGGGANNAGGQCASEEKELREKVNSEPVPTTITGLKNHHVYVLGKSLLKFEGLRPGAKAAGLVRGCKVYSKSDVAKLRGASRWKQDGLKVKDSELETPAKVTTKKGEKDGEGTSKLYGDWQTEAWVPEAAVNGKVPKNEYGNVEFFDCCPAFLPPGTEHMQGDQIGRVAAKLGVDYAPALTGFETKQGRHVPVLDGIIVCKEQSQMLRDAHTAWEQTLLEKQVRVRGQKVLRRWGTLVRGVLLGAKLLEEYGDHD